MADLIRNKKIIFICILIIILVILSMFLLSNKSRFFNSDGNLYQESNIKNYKVNQYVPVYVTEADMANKYLNDYKNKLINNINEAYNLLNKDYREKKFESLDEFSEYIEDYKSISFYKLSVEEFSVVNHNGFKFYYINSSGDIDFIFKELSIMNYEVYLDDYTVRLK